MSSSFASSAYWYKTTTVNKCGEAAVHLYQQARMQLVNNDGYKNRPTRSYRKQ